MAMAVAGAVAVLAVGGAIPASGDPIGGGTARAYAISAQLNGTEAVPPTPLAETTAPAPDETDSTLVAVPASPLVISGTFIARSAVHLDSDLASELVQSAQPVAGPYNARAIGQIEGLSALISDQAPGGEVLHADVLRGEAVAVCKAGVVSYSAESEVVNLVIAGNDGLSGPLNELVDQITQGISSSPLAGVVDVDVNVLDVTAAGATVDALVITVLGAAGDAPLGQIRLGHAEVSGVTCAVAAVTPTTAVLGIEQVPEPPLPRTGGSAETGLAAVLGVSALALFALRRRLA